ncbi:MAG TPA: MucB/RseB C-terminal domain-containing protein [Steroidobacteraceae bacterium]|nr:MucB/RseB C-terminal domain-containing protein [Steroidobacteraceae bacterium]
MPRATRSSERLPALLLAWVAAGAAATALAADDPADWLARMNRALTTRNYDGTFSHWHAGTVEMLRIIHRVRDGRVAERLVSLDGSGREFIRSGSNLTCYLPDKRLVVVEQRAPQEPLVGFPEVDNQSAGLYDISETARTRLNRHDTHVITVAPRDEFRYGYRLWIDDATAMPLKTQLCDAHGRVIEQIVFASLALPARIPDSAFRPEVSTAGFEWLRSDAALPAAPSPQVWNALKLPPGFRMMTRQAQMLPGASDPVDHLVFSDGLASVSVFVESRPDPGGADQAPVVQSARVGSSSAFSTVVDGHKVTAVGEVPPATVRFIASQVKAQTPTALGSRHP